MFLVILLLLIETVDKMWHICYNVKMCISIKEFKNYYNFPWIISLIRGEMWLKEEAVNMN
jgi:hypothetical protein